MSLDEALNCLQAALTQKRGVLLNALALRGALDGWTAFASQVNWSLKSEQPPLTLNANTLAGLTKAVEEIKGMLDPDELSEVGEALGVAMVDVGSGLGEHLVMAGEILAAETEGQLTELWSRAETLIDNVVSAGETVTQLLENAGSIAEMVASQMESAGGSIEVADEIVVRTQEAINSL